MINLMTESDVQQDVWEFLQDGNVLIFQEGSLLVDK